MIGKKYFIIEMILFFVIVLGSTMSAYYLTNEVRKDAVYMHELSHQKVFQYTGCDSKIVMDKDGLGGYTMPLNCTTIDKDVMLAQAMIEGLSYNQDRFENFFMILIILNVLYSSIICFLLIRLQPISSL